MKKKYLVLLLIPLLIILIGCGKKSDLEAPSNLTVTAISYKQINLSWQDNSTTEDGFRVCCDMGLITKHTHYIYAYRFETYNLHVGGNQYQTVVTLPTNTISFEHYHLQPMTKYTYYIQACRSDQCASSKEVSVTTPCPVMIAYSNIGRISNYSFAIMGKVQSYADEPCLAEITVCIYNPDIGLLDGIAKDTFYIGPVSRDFRIDCSTQHVLAGSYDNYTVEITDVEIEY